MRLKIRIHYILCLLMPALSCYLSTIHDNGRDLPDPPEGWVVVKSGSFMMGSPEKYLEDYHRVTLTNSFLIQDHEVTQEEFEKLLGYNPSHFIECGGDCPVENVNWHEAAAFCNALSESAGLEHCYTCIGSRESIECELDSELSNPYQCSGFRLPTEAEWEYAARAGTKTETYNGDLEEGLRYGFCEPSATLDPIEWYCDNSGKTTHSVGLLVPNAWKIYDMLGNVGEWCQDWHTWHLGHDAATDPWGPRYPVEYIWYDRLVRGGCWGCYAEQCISAARWQQWQTNRRTHVGFRPVRTLDKSL